MITKTYFAANLLPTYPRRLGIQYHIYNIIDLKISWQTILSHITNIYKNEIGLTHTTRYEESIVYMWINVLEHNQINAILDELDKFYYSQTYKFPSLITLITKKLEDKEYFADSLCEYQAQNGKINTKHLIYVYFRDII